MRKEVQTREPRRLIVFTDLDGTLLNHGDYSWEAARPALEKTRELGIPLVICTSKTRPEVELLRAEIGAAGPFIVENGGGIFFPREYDDLHVGSSLVMDTYRCIPLGIPYARIRAFIEETAETFAITGFGDMTVEEVSRLTGLDARRASLARQREFSEPFILAREEDLHEIERLAHLKGLTITRGGRFYHCMGYGNDKGGSVKRVRDIFARHWRGGVTAIGFGDSPNDFPLLEAVDIPVLIPHDDGSYEGLDLPGLVHAPYPGSRGWNAAALSVIAGADGGIRDGQS
ncbi:MAG: Glucosyl-3-phosphoglycerate/mannosyl-3-phosphoglycerate phosphatase [Deltaproteobacteria bacterium ADurb.Bin072]|nr:MAG: Glucosyl-3-phosphoglycerate/mannosyl-3-phosphoglycerate phosphatase [Deltaproteobacteria bacterium ADurb.Bin072]